MVREFFRCYWSFRFLGAVFGGASYGDWLSGKFGSGLRVVVCS